MKSLLQAAWQHHRLKLAIKILLSGLALWFVYTRIDLHAVLQQAARIPAGYIIAAAVLYNVSQFISAKRLLLFLQQEAIRISFAQNLKLYYQGMYYNLLLPGGLGGDGYKVYQFKKHQHVAVKKSIRALLTDRINGAVAVTLLAATGMLFIPVPQFPAIKIWIALLIAVALTIPAIIVAKLVSAYTHFWWKAFGYSVIVQGLQASAAAALLIGMQQHTSTLLPYLVVFMVGSLASAIPVTVGGLGARELVFVLSAQYLLVHTETAVSLAMIFFLITVISALPGMLLQVNYYEKKELHNTESFKKAL